MSSATWHFVIENDSRALPKRSKTYLDLLGIYLVDGVIRPGTRVLRGRVFFDACPKKLQNHAQVVDSGRVCVDWDMAARNPDPKTWYSSSPERP